MQRYSSAVLLTVRRIDLFESLQSVSRLIADRLRSPVQVKILQKDTYLLCYEGDTGSSLYSLLSGCFESSVASGKIEIIPWTPGYGSLDCMVSCQLRLKRVGLPCNLNIPAVT